MGYYNITAGDKVAKVAGARFIKSKTGKVAVEVAFRFEENGAFETLSYQAWLSEKAIENSMDMLVNILGYNGSEEVNSEGLITDKNAFHNNDVKLVVELQARVDENGVQKVNDNGDPIFDPKIKWVNSLSGSAFAGIEPQTIKQELNSVNFKAMFMSTMKKSGKTIPEKGTIRNHAPGADNGFGAKTKEDIPF